MPAENWAWHRSPCRCSTCGTESRNALEIAAEEERLGANLSAGSNLDASSVTLSALKSELEESIDLMADVLLNPVFDDEEIERLRGQWIADIAQEKAQPVQLALRLLPPAIYGEDHAYGVPFTGTGTEASIASLTRDDLVAFKDAWLRPGNATIFVAGDTTLDQITPMLEDVLGNWTAPDTPAPTKNVADVALPESPRMILIDIPNSPQSLILSGHLAPGLGSDGDLAVESMNDVLGGSFTSRVNMNLREDKGWAYGAQTLFQNARGQRPFLVYAPVQTDRTGDSLLELIRELEAVQGSRSRLPKTRWAGRSRAPPAGFRGSFKPCVRYLTA